MSDTSGFKHLALALLTTTVPVLAHGQLAVTKRVSIDSLGSQSDDWSVGPSPSADGRFIAFYSYASNLVPGDTNLAPDVFVRDRLRGVTERISVDSQGHQGNSASLFAFITPDGRFVSFTSWASNLVPGDTNGVADVFVHDRQTGVTERVSVDSFGNEGNNPGFPFDRFIMSALSADGRLVVFTTDASNLVPGDGNGK